MTKDSYESLKQYLSKSEIKDINFLFSLTKAQKKTLTDKDILGYDPTIEQLDWPKWAFDGKNSQKLFMGSRGYGKSDMILIYGVTKKLIENPSLTFLVMTRTQERVQSIVQTIGSNLKEAGIKGRYLATRIELDQMPTNPKTNKKQPTILAMTINGRTKGHHADYLIMDDPVDPLDEHMSAIKRRVRKVYYESSNIAKNIIIIGQYVSEDDIYRQLEDKVDTLRAWHGTIPKLDINREEFLKTRTDREWGLNYGGYIVAGSEAPFRDIQTIDSKPIGTVFAFIDPSFKGNDYTALSIGWRVNDFIVVAGFLFEESWARALEKLNKKVNDFGVKKVYYENNGVGDALYFASGKQFLEEPSKGNKEGRISRLEALVNNGGIKLSIHSDKSYIEQVKLWSPLGIDHDDAPDSLASLCKIIGI